MLNRLISGRWSGWAHLHFGARSSANFHDHTSSSLASRPHRPQMQVRAIDRARSHYLSRPSLPVRQHASSCRKHTHSRPNLGHFFLRRAARDGRCSNESPQGHPHRSRAPRRQPEACRRAANTRYVCCAQSAASLRVKLSPHLQR